MSTYVTYRRRRVLNTAAGIRGKHGTSYSSPSSPRAESGPNNEAAYDAAHPLLLYRNALLDGFWQALLYRIHDSANAPS